MGEENCVIDTLILQGKVKRLSDDSYEVFSQEVVQEHGEVAFKGDYIKVDSDGFPYPNNADFFVQIIDGLRKMSMNRYQKL